ncbi:DUF1127 domain-containing protein [Leisingera daeponensis]|uniref:DUF1127 domain-containing protein n=1 Tax=Leisingera daeponensis TaxID=405746 RepID=A0ABS7NKM2_9RHOB|nr:hypothetical protein [Leisingera daeponensis]MBY6141738.1 DUF1127 domain-containing protein [Leisingera daeponensis]
MAEMLSQMNLWHVISRVFAFHRHGASRASQTAGQQELARRRLSHLPEHLLRDIGL